MCPQTFALLGNSKTSKKWPGSRANLCTRGWLPWWGPGLSQSILWGEHGPSALFKIRQKDRVRIDVSPPQSHRTAGRVLQIRALGEEG